MFVCILKSVTEVIFCLLFSGMIEQTFSVAEPADDAKAFSYLGESWRERLRQCGYDELFPLQVTVIERTLKPMLGFRPSDLCVAAPTGSGKTLAYVVPIVNHLETQPLLPWRTRALVILPVRDLALQVAKVFQKIISSSKSKFYRTLRVSTRVGEKSDNVEDPDIVVATPGKVIETLAQYENLEFLVFDEADRLLQRRFVILLRSMGAAKNPPRRLLFSATLTRDPEVFNGLELFYPMFLEFQSGTHKSITDKPNNPGTRKKEIMSRPDTLKEHFMKISKQEQKPLAVWQIIKDHKQSLVFTNSVDASHRLTLLLKNLTGEDFSVEEFSSQLSQKERQQTVKRFARGDTRVLVASDAMARGMDFSNIDCVVSYDLPRRWKTYVHRVGRTARAGKVGNSYVLVEAENLKGLNNLFANSGEKKIQEVPPDLDSWKECESVYKESLELLKKSLKSEEKQKTSKKGKKRTRRA